ncbi:MAG: TonB-dependent receptor [Pseudomonadota bacterium]
MFVTGLIATTVLVNVNAADAKLTEELAVPETGVHALNAEFASLTTVTDFDVPAGSMKQALLVLSQQGGFQISFRSSNVDRLKTQGLKGRYTGQQALDKLLEGRGLNTKPLDDARVIVAQAATGTSSDAGEEVTILDRIYVTARRTEEEIKDVPASVIVIGDEELIQSNLDDGTDVYRRLPNVSYTQASNPTDTSISVRGISSLVGTGASAPTVGVFVDGVLVNPTNSTAGINPNLVDLERVEAIYGPQGTAFGRGTIGGAINFVSKKPTDEFEGSITTELSSYPNTDSFDTKATVVVNTPILEDGLLSARLVGFGAESDGFLDFVSVADPDTNEASEAGVRLSLRSRPLEQVTLDATASYDRNLYTNANSPTNASFVAGNPVNTNNFFGEDQRLEREFYTFNALFEGASGNFNSSTSYFTIDTESSSDGDRTPFDFLTLFGATQRESFAQEFRFESKEFELSNNAGTVSFNLGATGNQHQSSSFSTLDPGGDVFMLVPIPLPPGFDDGGVATTFSNQEVTNFGVYGDIRWNPMENLEIAIGGRYSRDRVSFDGLTTSTGLIAGFIMPVPLLTGDETFQAFTPNASIKYDWTDDLSTYLSYSTGYRSGGFNNTFNPTFLSFDEEFAQSFEVGLKSSWMDGRLLINASAFYIEYEDIQVLTAQPIAGPGAVMTLFFTDNAAEARSVGGEIGITYFPIDGLMIDAQLGLTFAEFTDYSDSAIIDPMTGMPGFDLTGFTLPNAPEQTLSVVVEYEHPEPIILNANPFIRGEYTYRSDFTTSVNPFNAPFDGFDLFNLRAGLRGETFEFSVFAENLFDEIYATGTSSSGAAAFVGGVPNFDIGERRRVGVIGKFTF